MQITFIHLGEFAQAMLHFEKALLLYDPERHRDDSFRYTQNPGVAMQCFAAWALWFLGQPDRALHRIEEALSLARELSEPHGLVRASFFAAILHQLRREARLAQERAEAAIAVSNEHRLLMYQAYATVTHGWALIEQGLGEKAIEPMRQGLAARRATGTELMRPHLLAQLAESLEKTCQPEEGLGILEEALATAHRTGERYYEAELYRLKGELLLMQPRSRRVLLAATGGKVVAPATVVANAASCFNQAILVARRQKAKSLELRAAMSVARLYQNQGRQEEARSLLTEVYSQFTEGFDTKDVSEANVLLGALKRCSGGL